MAEDHDHDHDHSSHDVLVAKCVAMACLFCATALFGGLPFIFNHYLKWTDKSSNTRSAKVVTYLLYFGGGVLLATTFIHLLPEVQEVMEKLQTCHQIPKFDFAMPELLMCVGFFLMYFIEECVHSYLHRHKKALTAKDDGVGAAFERGHSVRNSYLVKGGLKKKTQDSDEDEMENNLATVKIPNSYDNQAYVVNSLSFNDKQNNFDKPIINTASDIPNCHGHSYTLEHSLEHTHKPSLDHTHNYSVNHSHDHGHGHSHLPIAPTEGDDVVTSSLRGLGIVLALSLHEVFEGLAIGLSDSSSSVWFLFGGVAAHKLVLAFCVGVELIVARTKPILAIVYTITFAIVSPIGIAIGILVSHNSIDSGSSLTSMILQGIACGTLLYVVFFEILSKNHVGLVSFLTMLVGFGLMFGLQNIGGGHDHDHECQPSTNTTTTPSTDTIPTTTTVATIVKNLVTSSQ